MDTFKAKCRLFPRRVLVSPWEGGSPGGQLRWEHGRNQLLLANSRTGKEERTPLFSGGWDEEVSEMEG